ncbi:MAG: nucleoside deaminase [Chlamydiia bacterium]
MNKATIDEGFMRIALKAAKNSFEKGEVPIGAVIVDQGEIVSIGSNSCEENRSQTYHAEMVALSHIEKEILVDAVAYVTHEPCLMCLMALVERGVKKIVYGTFEPRWGCLGSVVDLQKELSIEVTRFVLQEECKEIIQSFFKQRRNK